MAFAKITDLKLISSIFWKSNAGELNIVISEYSDNSSYKWSL